ncbi:hypothetical protein ACSS6W_000337 [Trichoderma asperelloides]
MAPDIANKLKATLFRRRRRESSASTTDGFDPISPPTTPGVVSSSRRPSFPFPREPSSQTLSLSLELMTGDAGIGIGGCGGSDDLSDAGDSAQTSNDADQQQQQQQRPRQQHHLWKRRRRSKQGIDLEKRHSVPEGGTVDEDLTPLASPDMPVSPTSQVVAPTAAVAALSPSKQTQDIAIRTIESDKEAKDEYSIDNGKGNDSSAGNGNVISSGNSISHGNSNDNDNDNGSELLQQQEIDRPSPAATTDMETASVSAASAASVLTTASATSASTSAALQQASAGEQPPQLSPPALDQRQLQRPRQLPASAGGRAEDQTPSRSLDGHEASRHQHQSQSHAQLDGQGLSVINSDQGTAQAGTAAANSTSTAATGASAGADAGARITAASAAAAADGPSTGTASPGSDTSASTIVSAGPVSGDLQQQRQQQKQAQKRPRQPAPPFPPSSLPTTPTPLSLSQPLSAPALVNFPALATPTSLPLPSLPSLDSIDEDESQSPSQSQPPLQQLPQSQSQSSPLQSPESDSQSQSQSPFQQQQKQEQLLLVESEQQPQQQQQQQQQEEEVPSSALPTTAAAATPEAQHLAAAAVSGRGFHAPSSPDAGHGPLNLNLASPQPPIDAQQLSSQLPATSSTAPESSPAAAISATSVSTSAASTFAENSSLPNASARPSAPPRRASRDSNQTVTFDDSVQHFTPPARRRSLSKKYKTFSYSNDTANAPRTPGAETPVSVIVTPSYLAPPTVSANAPLHPSHLIEVETTSSLGDDFESSSMAEAARKIWVTRPRASATLVTIASNDLVDDVRDMILRKYANSLGKTYDSPDLTLRLNTRTGVSRVMGPEEHMATVMEQFFPNGQTVDEAFIIDIPRNTTTPRPSPRAPPPPIPASGSAAYYADDVRPSESGEGYFPPVVGTATSPRLATKHTNGSIPHSMTVISSGHLPPIPSPGGSRPRSHRDRESQRQDHSSRSAGRNHTPSPNVHGGGGSSGVGPNSASYHPTRHSHSRTHSSSSEHIVAHPSNSMPRSPGHEIAAAAARMGPGTPPTPPQRLVSPHLPTLRTRKSKRAQTQQQDYQQNPPPPALNAKVPPISVLIVEDNPINLKLLEAFVKRLKVRWQTAMNGREAVKKWRSGGFHLVLMDIQLPGMNGLEATREIRRLERINGIGVFSNAPAEATPPEELTEEDRLEGLTKFKSPVIIVALTASSLQSDRHEALAAGCNDFLTKPVNFVWLERKVMEWGCMQALIDYQGWREWKQYSAKAEAMEAANKRAQAFKKQSKKNRTQLSES